MGGPGAELRRLMREEAPVVAPLCLEALTGRLIEQTGFRALYVGGGALGYSMAVSEALLTVTEVATVTRQVAQRVGIPVIVDGTVGFGDAIHTVRTVWELEAAGAAGVELGDQVAPKRAHHHKGIDHLVETHVFAEKIEEAARARRDPDFVLIARTGAARDAGVDDAIVRSHAYVEAGADAVLLAGVPDADWERVRKAFDVPLVIMGRQTRAQAAELGAALVLDPYSTQIVAFRAMREALAAAMRDEPPEEALMAVYRDLPGVIGIDQLYEIEARTTEKDLYS